MFPVLVVCTVVAVPAQAVRGMLAYKAFGIAHTSSVCMVTRALRLATVHEGDRVGTLKRTCCEARRPVNVRSFGALLFPPQYDVSISSFPTSKILLVVKISVEEAGAMILVTRAMGG